MEEWKVIKDYENYAINKNGQVKSIRFNRMLKPSINESGYQYLNLVKNKISKTHSVHKLVIENFGGIKPNPNFVVDHKDGNKTNNNISNLEWVSIKENTERGYKNHDVKQQILDLHKNGHSIKQIKEITSRSESMVRQTILKNNSVE